MVDIAKLKVGDKVYYTSASGKIENGIVKEVPEDSLTSVRVVYNCAGDWENYKLYTSALTNARDLNYGWKHE